MSLSSEPAREHPSTYFVQDRSNQEEMNLLQIQDHLLTSSMGGVLPEQPDPTAFQSVLDIGCGTGGWLIDLAKSISTCARLVGVDMSLTFVEYARSGECGAGERPHRVSDDGCLIVLVIFGQIAGVLSGRYLGG